MTGGLLDDPALIATAAAQAGIDPDELRTWTEALDTEAALEADADAARRPNAAARALDHKLGGPAHRRRYSAPTYVIDGYAIPGFNPVETYETAIANLDPQLTRRPRPGEVAELLAWATEPLATAEVALVMGIDIDAARRRLQDVGRFQSAGADGYWTLQS
jgi:hypothetical protein